MHDVPDVQEQAFPQLAGGMRLGKILLGKTPRLKQGNRKCITHDQRGCRAGSRRES